ncbi:MAG: hypothetical protein WBW03_02105 [Silvibacterium sp.]
MPNQAAIPAAIPCVSLQHDLRTLAESIEDESVWESPSLSIGQGPAERAAEAADFMGRERDESYVPERVSRSVSRFLFGHGFRACPAPGGSSLFCFGCATRRVTVSVEILFRKYAEKISPDPP